LLPGVSCRNEAVNLSGRSGCRTLPRLDWVGHSEATTATLVRHSHQETERLCAALISARDRPWPPGRSGRRTDVGVRQRDPMGWMLRTGISCMKASQRRTRRCEGSCNTRSSPRSSVAVRVSLRTCCSRFSDSRRRTGRLGGRAIVMGSAASRLPSADAVGAVVSDWPGAHRIPRGDQPSGGVGDDRDLGSVPERAGFQNSATGLDLGIYAARSYSLMRPPRTGRRLIRCWEISAAGWPGRGGRSSRLRWGRRPW
jgi:hypothetical protein